MSNTEIWFRGLLAAAIGGLSSALAAWLAAPQAFDFSKPGLIAFAKVIIVGAGLPAFAYLKQSPLPPASVTATTQTDTQTPEGTESTKSSVTITKN